MELIEHEVKKRSVDGLVLEFQFQALRFASNTVLRSRQSPDKQ